MSFTCPECGSNNWGSGYNFDGPSDDPADAFRGPGIGPIKTKNSKFDGTWTRICHGYIGNRACSYTWNSRDDAKHSIDPPPKGRFVGQQRPT